SPATQRRCAHSLTARHLPHISRPAWARSRCGPCAIARQVTTHVSNGLVHGQPLGQRRLVCLNQQVSLIGGTPGLTLDALRSRPFPRQVTHARIEALGGMGKQGQLLHLLHPPNPSSCRNRIASIAPRHTATAHPLAFRCSSQAVCSGVTRPPFCRLSSIATPTFSGERGGRSKIRMSGTPGFTPSRFCLALYCTLCLPSLGTWVYRIL